MTITETLKQLCEAAGVNGMTEAATVAAELLRELCDAVTVDDSGNVIALRYGTDKEAPALLLEAHIDQVGFVVTGVDEKGFVRVAACGRADTRALPAARVVVYGDKPYHGVFCSVPPHLAKEAALPELSDLGIDVGMDRLTAIARIHSGDRVAFCPRLDTVGKSRLCGTSLDNRAGCAAILHALEQLKNTPLRRTVAVVFAAKEEVGGQGVVTACYGVKPACALVTDVSFALTPDADPFSCGKLGGGMMLGYAPILDKALTDALEDLAKRESIPYQPEVMGGLTGTDADKITVSRNGVPTALLSVPLRYMHTPVELVDVRDIEAVGDLMAAYIRLEEVAQ